MSPFENKTPQEFENVWRLLGLGAVLLLFLSCWYPTDAYRDLGSMIQFGWLVFFLASGVSAVALNVSLSKSGLGILSTLAFLTIFLLLSQSWAPYEPMAHRRLGSLYTLFMVGGGALFWTAIGCRFQFFSSRLLAVVLCGLIALLAAHGIYQVMGSASLPGTFASHLESIRENSELYSLEEFIGLEHALSKARATSRIGSPNVFASFLIMGIPLTFMGMRVFTQKVQKAGFALALILILWALVLSVSRGGMLFSGVAILLSLVFLLPQFHQLIKTAGVAAMMLVSGVAVAGSLVEKLGGLSTLQQRFYYWEAALGIWKTTPIRGAGPGSFELLYAQFRVSGSQETRLAHSWFFNSLAEFGVVGILGIATLIVLTFCIMFNASKKRPSSPFSLALLMSLVAVSLHGLIEYSFSFTAFLITFAAFWGVGVGASLPCENDESRKKIHVGIIAILGCCFAVMWYQGSLIPGRVEVHHLYAKDSFATGQFGLAEDDITNAIKWEPSNSELYEFRSVVRQRLGKDPLPDLERALNAQPTSARLHEQMAMINSRVGNMKSAIEWQEKAVALHPLDVLHRMNLADLYFATEDPESAKQVLQGIDRFKMGNVERQRLANYEVYLLND